MTTPIQAHLSNDQFLECVTLAPSDAAELHLAGCERCRRELSTFAQSMQDFGRTTSAWSEAMPKRSLRPLVQQAQRRTLVVRSAWAFAAALLVAVSVPVLENHRAASTERSAVLSQSAGDSNAQIAADNQLMQNVYVALTPRDTSPLQEYGMQSSADSLGHSRSKARMQ